MYSDNIIGQYFHRRAWKMGFDNANKRMQRLVSEISESEDHNRLEDYGKTVVYKRKKVGWEAFECPCGIAKQLSPSMQNKEFYCTKCGRKIKIVSDELLISNLDLSPENMQVYGQDIIVEVDEHITKNEKPMGCLLTTLLILSFIGIILSFTIKTPDGAGAIGAGIAIIILIFNLIIFFVIKEKIVKIASLLIIGFFLAMLLFNIIH